MTKIPNQVTGKIINLIEEFFSYFDVKVTEENLIIDSCKHNEQGISCVFCIKEIGKIKKVLFDEVVDFVIETRDDIQIKMLREKSGRNVKFQLLYTNDKENNPIYPPIKQNPI